MCKHIFRFYYKRNGTAQRFIFTEALAGWRYVSVRECRTATDWVEGVRVLLDEVSPLAKRVVLGCDNLDTHSLLSLSKTFGAEEAERQNLGDKT